MMETPVSDPVTKTQHGEGIKPEPARVRGINLGYALLTMSFLIYALAENLPAGNEENNFMIFFLHYFELLVVHFL